MPYEALIPVLIILIILLWVNGDIQSNVAIINGKVVPISEVLPASNGKIISLKLDSSLDTLKLEYDAPTSQKYPCLKTTRELKDHTMNDATLMMRITYPDWYPSIAKESLRTEQEQQRIRTLQKRAQHSQNTYLNTHAQLTKYIDQMSPEQIGEYNKHTHLCVDGKFDHQNSKLPELVILALTTKANLICHEKNSTQARDEFLALEKAIQHNAKDRSHALQKACKKVIELSIRFNDLETQLDFALSEFVKKWLQAPAVSIDKKEHIKNYYVYRLDVLSFIKQYELDPTERNKIVKEMQSILDIHMKRQNLIQEIKEHERIICEYQIKIKPKNKK